LAAITLAVFVTFGACLTCPCSAQEGGALEPFVRLYDTGAPAGDEGIAESLPAGADWQLVAEGKTGHEFAGGGVIRNDRVAILLRPAAGRAELYARVETGWAMRCSVSADPAIGAATVQISENAGSAVEAVLGEGAQSLTFRMTLGEPIVGVTPGEDVEALALGAEPAHVVLPEFFADDLLYSSQDLAVDSLPVPADNQVLAMLEEPRGILMCLWRRSGRRTAVLSRGGRDGRAISGLRLSCAGREPTWLACLESPAVWQGTGSGGGWAAPFPAHWRLTAKEPEGGWVSVRLADMGSREYLSPVVYPIDRTAETPLTIYCPIDVLRNTLGCGPCQYVLDTEGAGAEQQVTPDSVADWVERQFERGRQQRRADQIEQRLEAAVGHVAWMSARIEAYGVLGQRVGAALPVGAEALARVPPLTDALAAGPRADALAVAATERARELADGLSDLARDDGTPQRAAELCAELRAIGASQDRALAKCRLTVRRIRLALDDVPDRALADAVRALLDEFEKGQSLESEG
jgi:hypothetical protein